MTKQHWVTVLLPVTCLVLNIIFKQGKINVQILKTPPSASVQGVLGSVEVRAAPDGQMYSTGKGNTVVPLTFHVDLPGVGSSQPFAVVSLTTEQCCFIQTCRGKTKDLFAAPMQNAKIIPTLHCYSQKKKKDCGFLCSNVALLFSSNTKGLFFSTTFCPSGWQLAG